LQSFIVPKQLAYYIEKLRPKSFVVGMAPGTVFTSPPFLRNLQICV